jgi:hypothetical protein
MRISYIYLTFIVICLSSCFNYEENHHHKNESLQGTFAPLHIGMTPTQVEALGLPTKSRIVSYEDEKHEELVVSTPKGDVEIYLLQGIVARLSTSSTQFHTKRGVFVGVTINELKALYPEGRLISGFGDGGYLNFILQSEGGVFEFSAEGLSENCLTFGEDCPADFGVRRSVRFFLN